MPNDDLDKALSDLRKTFARSQAELARDLRLDALYYPLLMQHVFATPLPLTAMTGWSVAPEFAWWLFEHVRTHRPQRVIELGSGVSTVVIASALRQNGEGRLLAFEHDPVYLDKTRALLEACGLTAFVDLVLAPLKPCTLDDAEYRWYDIPWKRLDEACAEHGAALVLVDGPPKSTGPNARYPAHRLLGKYYAPSTVVILDDADRDSERKTLARWREEDPRFVRSETLSDFRHTPVVAWWQSGDRVATGSGAAASGSTVGDDPAAHPALLIESIDLADRLRRAEDLAARCADELDAMRVERDHALEDVRRQAERIGALRQQLSTLQQQLLRAQKQVSDLRNSLSLRLGTVIGRNLRSPLGWLRMPFELVAALRRPTAPPKAVGPETTPAVGAEPERASPTPDGCIASPEKPPQATRRRHVLWHARTVAQTEGIEAAIRHAEEHAGDDERHAIDILRANRDLDHDEAWLTHVNAYLAHYGTSPVALAAGSGPRFYRLIPAAGLPRVESGPLISVIMPAYKAEATLREAAGSILQQTWQALELIIVDDASPDRTHEIAQELAREDARVRVLRNAANVGPYVSKNRALQIAHGAYVTGHDADDWAHPERLERQVAQLLRAPGEVTAVLSYMLRIDEAGAFTHLGKISSHSPDGAARLASISCMFDAQFLRERLGHWDSVRFGADSEMIARAQIAAPGGLVRLPHIGMFCLDLETSLTNHPEHGVDKTHGVSATRLEYREAWEHWHRALETGASTRLSFPHYPREFPAPAAALVSAEALAMCINGEPIASGSGDSGAAAPEVAARDDDGSSVDPDKAFRFGFVLFEESTQVELGGLAAWREQRCDGFRILIHPEAPSFESRAARGSALVIGDVYTCHGGRSVSENLNAFIDGEDWEALDALGGRFCLLVARDGKLSVLHDPFGARSVYYRESLPVCVGSHAALLARLFGDRIDAAATQFMGHPEHTARGVAYLPGDRTMFRGIRALIPNNLLDLSDPARVVTRRYWPRAAIHPTTREAFLEEVDRYFAATAAFLEGRYVPILGLTGGVDSRAVIAALKPRLSDMRLVTWTGRGLSASERRVVEQMAHHLALPHEFLDTDSPAVGGGADLSRVVQAATGYSRLGHRLTASMMQRFEPNAVFIRGYGGEILRGFYNRHRARIGDNLVEGFSRLYTTKRAGEPSEEFATFVRKAFVEYLRNAHYDAEFFDHDIRDIFYWEQRMGVWACNMLNEMDPAVHALCGINSRPLFEMAFGLPSEYRLGKRLLLDIADRYDPAFARIGQQS